MIESNPIEMLKPQILINSISDEVRGLVESRLLNAAQEIKDENERSEHILKTIDKLNKTVGQAIVQFLWQVNKVAGVDQEQLAKVLGNVKNVNASEILNTFLVENYESLEASRHMSELQQLVEDILLKIFGPDPNPPSQPNTGEIRLHKHENDEDPDDEELAVQEKAA